MLDVKNLSKTFSPGTVNQRTALQNLTLHLNSGDFLTIIGSNGAGKSTLFNAISGVFLPDSGSIALGGKDITFAKEHKRATAIGRIFQDTNKGTAPNMTIEENLALAYLRSSGKRSLLGITQADRRLFREQLSLLDLGLENRLTTKVGLLSGGQRQAVALLMCTLVTPRLLLLDEHTAALDPATAEKVLAITKNIVQEKNITCMMITHNISSALQLGNRTIMMDDGHIVLDLTGEDRAAMTVPRLLEVFKAKVAKDFDNDRMLLQAM